MRTLMLSYWRNDAERTIYERAAHLLSKWDVCRWIWVVGDCADNTEEILRSIPGGDRVLILRADTGIVGEDIDTRRRRISATETLAYAELTKHRDIDYVVQHESDLRTSPRIVQQLMTLADDRTIVGGWPTLDLGGSTVFYDTWAYRGLDREHFAPHAPYHPDYRRDKPFEVASLGSVWMGPWAAWVDRVIRQDCCVELCEQWRADGYRCLVDPKIVVEQPRDLWVMS